MGVTYIDWHSWPPVRGHNWTTWCDTIFAVWCIYSWMTSSDDAATLLIYARMQIALCLCMYVCVCVWTMNDGKSCICSVHAQRFHISMANNDNLFGICFHCIHKIAIIMDLTAVKHQQLTTFAQRDTVPEYVQFTCFVYTYLLSLCVI